MTLICTLSPGKVVPLFVLMAILQLGCRSSKNPVVTIVGDSLPSVVVNPKINQLPSDTSDSVYNGLTWKDRVVAFYETRDNKLAWSENKEQFLRSDSMISFIENVRYYGLLPRNYHINEIRMNKNRKGSQHNDIRLDVLLTDAFCSIANDLKYGRMNNAKNREEDSLLISVLRQAIANQNVQTILKSQEPSFLGYKLLKEALWLALDTLNVDDREVLLRGYTYNVIPLHQKIQALEINLERWRGEKKYFGRRYLLINIPAYRLDVVLDDSVILESKVIVGKPETPTPVLSSSIECLSIYPYWNVPRKIAITEYLPIIQQDRSFLARNNFDVLDRKGRILNPDSMEWNKFNENFFPVMLRQREGPDNSLGIIKFVFDNPYAVFLHDTNSKRLFNSNVRSLSHGCIRVEKAIELGHYLVTSTLSKQSSTLEKQLMLKTQYTIDLPQHTPIHIRYFTCEFRDGVFYLYKDIYKEDQKIFEVLYK